MTAGTPEPEGTAPSPDKSPPHREEGRPYYMNQVKPGQHRGGKTFWQRFQEELYADNTFTVTISGKVSGAEHDKLKKRYEGRELIIKGTVELYKDKPQINVQHMEDIRVR